MVEQERDELVQYAADSRAVSDVVGHVTVLERELLHHGFLGREELEGILQHAQVCRFCNVLLFEGAAGKEFGRECLQALRRGSETPHPEPGQLLAYVEGELDVVTLALVDYHLRDCAACWSKLGQVQQSRGL
jgi:hypothetical protein